MNDSSFYRYKGLGDIREYLYSVINGEMLDVLAQVIPERLIGLWHHENPEVLPFSPVQHRHYVRDAIQVLK